MLGFDDDFGRAELAPADDDPGDPGAAIATGARPKVFAAPPPPRPDGGSISSGSADFDPFADEEFVVKSNGSQLQMDDLHQPRSTSEEDQVDEQVYYEDDEEYAKSI